MSVNTSTRQARTHSSAPSASQLNEASSRAPTSHHQTRARSAPSEKQAATADADEGHLVNGFGAMLGLDSVPSEDPPSSSQPSSSVVPAKSTESQRSTAQVTEEEAWNNFLQSLKSSKWLQQPQHHQEHHRADHSSAAAAPRPSSLSPQPLAPPPRPSHQAQPPTDRPPLMSLRDLASRLGLAQQRVPVGPDVNTSKGEEAVVKPPNGSEAPAAPSPAAPADYPTPQSPVSRRLHLHHTAPPPDAGCQATAPDPTAPQTHHDRRLSQGSSLGIKRPRSPAEQREGSSSRRKEARHASKAFARQPTASTSHSCSFTDLAPSDSASNLKKGKRRADPDHRSSGGTGETSELLREDQPATFEAQEDDDEGGSKPPSDVSALYIPSNSANNLMPDADYFKRRLSMASSADTLKLECALVDSAVDLLNKSVHSTGAGLDLLETRGNSVSQIAVSRARSLIAREVMQKGFPAAQQLYADLQIMVFNDLRATLTNQLTQAALLRQQQDDEGPQAGPSNTRR